MYVRNYNSDGKRKPGKIIEQTGPLSNKCEVDDKIVKRLKGQLITVAESNNVVVPTDVPDTSITSEVDKSAPP